MEAQVKEEILEPSPSLVTVRNTHVSNRPQTLIELSSSNSDSSDSDDSSSDDDKPGVPRGLHGGSSKKQKVEVVLPVGFLDPLPPEERLALSSPAAAVQRHVTGNAVVPSCKQFWKAGDYEGAACSDWELTLGGMDHVRVHPKFLHSNATSHKWALGAFAELLDNSLDEVCNGATYVNVDMLQNEKDGSRMLLIEDNGGGMDPDKLRQCMSLGYSVKSKLANTIGQYGNGFKTSTMRLGADVIVFSRWVGQDGKSLTQSVGMLSYTFLRSTGKEDIVVPMLDYEKGGWEWNKIIRSSAADWDRNLETIVQWSPYSSEAGLLGQLNQMKSHGTRIIIYNLWEDDEGQLELDFDADQYDIQIRGVNRDEKKIQMAKKYPNSRHFLTYKHSLRSYVSVLYLRLPPGFRIILRGKDVEHHNVVNDMMFTQEITYRPQPGADGVPKDLNMVAVVTVGFVKDAKFHIDVQGFNVYHKNRLIKPFWRLWNAAGSDGRGVIGVLEANFVEPAHDKQGFERTTVLSRLEARLLQMQKNYWSTHCHKIGYAPRRNRKIGSGSADRETSPDYLPETSSHPKRKSTFSSSKMKFSNADKSYSLSHQKQGGSGVENFPKRVDHQHGNGHASDKVGNKINLLTKSQISPTSLEPSSLSAEDYDDGDVLPERANGSSTKKFASVNSFGKDGSHSTWSSGNIGALQHSASRERNVQATTHPTSKGDSAHANDSNFVSRTPELLEEENQDLRERLQKKEGEILGDLLRDLYREKERSKLLEAQLEELNEKYEALNKDQENLLDLLSAERDRRDIEEESLRKKLKEASNTIQELLDKVKLLEKMKSPHHKAAQ